MKLFWIPMVPLPEIDNVVDRVTKIFDRYPDLTHFEFTPTQNFTSDQADSLRQSIEEYVNPVLEKIYHEMRAELIYLTVELCKSAYTISELTKKEVKQPFH